MATATATSTASAVKYYHLTGTEQPFFAQEADGPVVKTAIPGPISQKAIKDLDRVFDTRSLNMIANYQKSFGN